LKIRPWDIQKGNEGYALAEHMNYEEEVLMQVRKILRAVELHSSKLATRFNLTTPQLIVLKALAKHYAMKPSVLAKEVSLSSATVTGILQRLESKRLVLRRKDQEDGRSVLISISPEGKEMLGSMPPMLQENFVSRFAKLQDWEKTLILSSLQRVTSMMSAEDIEAAPVLISGPVGTSAEELSHRYVNSDDETGSIERGPEVKEVVE